MSKPLAYLISWTTYGTWLQGDERGWVESGTPGIRPPDPIRKEDAAERMTDAIVVLSSQQRHLVEDTIRKHCEIRRWQLHAVNARTNHVHVVATADVAPEVVMSQLKAWCSRQLSEQAGLVAAQEGNRNGLKKWWTQHGSTKWINDQQYLHNAIKYVLERQ